MQSWSGVKLFSNDIANPDIPTKDGLLGLLSSCLGVYDQDFGVPIPAGALQERPHWLAQTRLWVRIDKPGELGIDYQIVGAPPPGHMVWVDRQYEFERAGKLPTAGTNLGRDLRGVDGKGNPVTGAHAIMKKKFLSDAEFIVGIEHETRLSELIAAVSTPEFATFLGRKQYGPTFPFVLGASSKSVLEIFHEMPVASNTVGCREVEFREITDRDAEIKWVTVRGESKKEVRAWQQEQLRR